MEMENKATEKVPGCCSQRWLLAYIGLFGSCIFYALRVNLSFRVVCMIKSPVQDFVGQNNTWNTTVALPNGMGVCIEETEESSHSNDRAEFDWDSITKSTLLASFFYGYIVTQVPGGMLADRYGAKRILLTVMVLSSVLTILTPVAARTTVVSLYAIQVLLGLLTGMAFPALIAMWGIWVPPRERSKLTSVCYAGCLGVLWSIAWWYIAADDPSKHPRITKTEVEYITGNINYNTDKQNGPIPWRSIVLAPCLWACLTAQVCDQWTRNTLLTNIPTFMKEVLKYDIQENGALSAVPYICEFVGTLSSGYASDYIRLRGWLNTTRTRKLFATIGSSGCIIDTGFCSCEGRSLAVALLSFAGLFMGLEINSYHSNIVDFAPKYAGLFYGITNTISAITGMVAPIYAGYMFPNNTPEEWRNVFFTCVRFDVFGIIVFLLFAYGELQDWAKDSDLNVDIEIEVTNKKEGIQSQPETIPVVLIEDPTYRSDVGVGKATSNLGN